MSPVQACRCIQSWRLANDSLDKSLHDLEHFLCGGVTMLIEGALFARRIISDLRKVRRLILEANMQTQTQTQAVFTMPVKPHRLIASDRVERTPVRRSDGTKVGTVERLMIDKVSGKVAYAVLSFGGFMGVGVKHIPIPWDRMTYNASLDAYEINLSDEELSHTPEDFDWGYRDDVIANLNFYRTPPY